MRGLPSILSVFRNELNKFNNTGERMLDSIYHKLCHYDYFESHFCREIDKMLSLCTCTQRCYGRHNVPKIL